MLALCLWQTQHRTAIAAFAIYVGLAITEFISSELKESAEFFVFAAASRDVAREHSKEYPNQHRVREYVIQNVRKHRILKDVKY
jgi:hypothetical protein